MSSEDSSTLQIPQTNSSHSGITSDSLALFRRYHSERDMKIRDRLVDMHINLVRYLASKFASRGEPIEDLIQVGTIGLIHAIDRFEPDRELKFSTFATPTITGEIRRYFRDKAWSVKVPRRMQELSSLVVKVRETLMNQLGKSPTIKEIAAAAGVTEEEALEAFEATSAYNTISLDTHSSSDSDSTTGNLGELIGGLDMDIQNFETNESMSQAFACLNAREKAVIEARYFKEMSQVEIAKMMNISQMQISRIQKQALKKLRLSFLQEDIN
jgi:RNA polymerase sigma-B factor